MRGSDGPGGPGGSATAAPPAGGAAVASAARPGPRPRPRRIAEAVSVLAGWGLAVAVLWPSLASDAPARLSLAALLAFWALAVWIVRSDLADFLIPDEASAALAALGLALAAGLAALDAPAGSTLGSILGPALGAAVDAASGAAATGAGGFALFWAVGAGFRALGRDALGHGDVKLAGALAVWLSPADAALALELAALAAVLALLASRRAGSRGAGPLPAEPLRDTAVPFGAFMAPAAWLVVLLAPPLRAAGWLPDAAGSPGWLPW